MHPGHIIIYWYIIMDGAAATLTPRSIVLYRRANPPTGGLALFTTTSALHCLRAAGRGFRPTGWKAKSGYGRREDFVENLLRFDPEKANVHQFLAAYLFSETAELSPALHPQLLAKALLSAAKAHNDGVAEELVSLLRRSHELIELDLCHGEPRGQARAALALADGRFRERLRELYWDLPDARLVQGHHIATGHPLEVERSPTLVKTKLDVLGHIIGDWVPQLTQESIKVFRFMLAAYRPRPSGNNLREGESHAEWKAHGRFVSDDEQNGILRLVREHVGTHPFTAEAIEPWLEQPNVPDEIQKILAMARARHGGPELAKRDIRNARVLAALDELEQAKKRSCRPETLEWIKEQVEGITLLEVWMTSLLEAMQPQGDDLTPDARRIGESDYVLGTIRIEFRVLESKKLPRNVSFGTSRWVELTVELPADCPEELGRDVFGRARHHIEKWRETHYDVSVGLVVQGGRTNLNLDQSFIFQR